MHHLTDRIPLFVLLFISGYFISGYGATLSDQQRGFFYATSHRDDSIYHDLCYTSRGPLAGKKTRSIRPP